MPSQSQPPAKLPLPGGFHHVAFRCRDAEETRCLGRGLPGLPLATGLPFDEISGSKSPCCTPHIAAPSIRAFA